MKKNQIVRMAIALGLTGITLLTPATAMASETPAAPKTTAVTGKTAATPVIARSKAWDDIHYTLGGFPESVNKVVYADCVFYLAPGITDADFTAVIAAGPKAVMMNTFNHGPLYCNPAYVVWNAEKTVILVHPLDFTREIEALEAISVSSAPPAGLSGVAKAETPAAPKPTSDRTTEYMLSAEYSDALRTEFYRILNEYRAENGLRQLEVNLELQKYADLRAAEQRILFGHTRPDGTTAKSGWCNSRNITSSRYSENVISCGALGDEPLGQAAYMFDRWKNSPGHNKIMLSDFDAGFTMAFGIFPEIDEHGTVSSGVAFIAAK